MQLAKPCIDVGIYTNDKDDMLGFYRDQVLLPYEEMLPVGGGVQQHRHGLNGSVLKVNHARNPIERGTPTGYRRLAIAQNDCYLPRDMTDPDGNRIRIVPRGYQGITAIEVQIAVSHVVQAAQFWQLLGAEPLGNDRWRVGTSIITLVQRVTPLVDAPISGIGIRYLTVQVFDVGAEHARLIGAGVREGRAPVTLGDVAKISFVRDPDGNWIEISQRRNLVGSLH